MIVCPQFLHQSAELRETCGNHTGVVNGDRLLAGKPGGQECHDEVVTREDWVPEYVTVPGRPSYYRAPPRDKRTKLRRVK